MIEATRPNFLTKPVKIIASDSTRDASLLAVVRGANGLPVVHVYIGQKRELKGKSSALTL